MRPYSTITDADVLEHQQDVIIALQQVGFERKVIADVAECKQNIINRLFASEPRWLNPARWERVRSFSLSQGIASAYNRFAPLEWCMARIPLFAGDDPSTTDDEVLDTAETIGRVRMDSLRGDWPAIIEHGWQMISIGWRLVLHGRDKLGIPRPAVNPAFVAPDASQLSLSLSGDGV